MATRTDRPERSDRSSRSERSSSASARPDASLADMLELIDGLDALVATGKRVVMYPGRVLVNVEDFMAIVDQLRRALPNEVQQARRVVQERQQILLEAQTEAEKIISVAKERAEYLISEKGLTAEARVRGEDELRRAKEQAKKSNSEIEAYAMQLFEMAEAGMRASLSKLEEARAQLPRAR